MEAGVFDEERALAVAPEEKRLASAGEHTDRVLRDQCHAGGSLVAVWLHAWPAHRERMRALAVDPGERWLATAGERVLWRVSFITCAWKLL